MGFCTESNRKALKSSLCRCQEVTKLELSAVHLANWPKRGCHCPPHLKEACFEEAVISKSWLNKFNEAAVGLQLLHLKRGCIFSLEDGPQLKPFTNLRCG